MNYFEELNAVNCNSMTEKKNGLTYLAWANAWKELKKLYPKSYYTVYENDLEWNYFTDNKTCWVKTGVTVVTDDGTELEHIEYLPVMDFRNKSIPQEDVTSFDVNKAIQRSLTKAVARHGLGLYIYAGEDLPDEKDGSVEDRKAQRKPRNNANKAELIEQIVALCDLKRYDVADIQKKCKCTDFAQLTVEQLRKAIDWLGEK